jgi:hypothetical protein
MRENYIDLLHSRMPTWRFVIRVWSKLCLETALEPGHDECMTDIGEVLDSVNRCQIAEMEKKARELDPAQSGSTAEFSRQVRNVQAAIIHTYQITAYSSLRQADPMSAAALWKAMSDLCDRALGVLRTLKDTYPGCGTNELYDLTLDYKIESDKRYYQNLEDAQWAKTPPPNGLFPKTI